MTTSTGSSSGPPSSRCSLHQREPLRVVGEGELVLAVEVAEHRAARHLGGGGDRLHGDALVALLQEQGHGGLGDPVLRLAGPLRRQRPPIPRLSHRCSTCTWSTSDRPMLRGRSSAVACARLMTGRPRARRSACVRRSAAASSARTVRRSHGTSSTPSTENVSMTMNPGMTGRWRPPRSRRGRGPRTRRAARWC